MSTNNGTSLNHSPTLTPAQGKSPTNPLSLNQKFARVNLFVPDNLSNPAFNISYLVTGILWVMGVTTTAIIWASCQN